MTRVPHQTSPPRRNRKQIVHDSPADRVRLAQGHVDLLDERSELGRANARLKLEREGRREPGYVSYERQGAKLDVLADVAEVPVALNANNLLGQVAPDHARLRLAVIRRIRHAGLGHAGPRLAVVSSIAGLLAHPCPPRHPARSPWTFSSHLVSFFGGCSSSHGSWNASGFALPFSEPNLSCCDGVAGDVGRERGAAESDDGGRGDNDLRSNACGGDAEGGL